MSFYGYRESIKLGATNDWDFEALIMAAMRKADTVNYEFLRMAFPKIEQELRDRYDSPGGLLPGEADLL